MITIVGNGQKVSEVLTRAIDLLNNPIPLYKSWSEGIGNQARINARSKGGRRFWRDQVANAVEVEFDAAGGHVFALNPVAVHKEFGGPIVAKNVQNLTIPIDKAARGKSVAQMQAMRGKKFFRFRSKKGNFLLGYGRKRGKKTELVPVFALKHQTRPQRADKWWPTDNDALTIGFDHAEKWLEMEMRNG